MNRFKIVLGREDDFETVWKSRETHLEGVKGFKRFNLIKGSSNTELYFKEIEFMIKTTRTPPSLTLEMPRPPWTLHEPLMHTVAFTVMRSRSPTPSRPTYRPNFKARRHGLSFPRISGLHHGRNVEFLLSDLCMPSMATPIVALSGRTTATRR